MGAHLLVVVVVVVERGVGPTPERSVSWRPGAEGAEGVRVRWECVVAWEEAGVMRIDWVGGVSLVV